MRSAIAALITATACATPAVTTTFSTDDIYAAHFTTAWAAYAAQTASDPPDQPTHRSREQRTLQVVINAPVAVVFARFSDVNQHFGLHPLLRHVVTHELSRTDGLRERRFTAIEDVDVGFGVVVPVETHAVTRIDAAHHRYTTESWTDPGVITRQIFVFTAVDNDLTRVDETITFEAPLLLLPTAVDGGFHAHSHFMAVVKSAIQGGKAKR